MAVGRHLTELFAFKLHPAMLDLVRSYADTHSMTLGAVMRQALAEKLNRGQHDVLGELEKLASRIAALEAQLEGAAHASCASATAR